MRSFIIIAGLSTKCTCLCKKKSLGVRHGYLSRILYCKSIRKSIFDKCKKRFETSQFDFSFSINVKTDLILLKLVLLLCSVVKNLNEYIM